MMDVTAIRQAMGDLEEDKVERLLDEFVAGSPTPDEAQQVALACQQGMEIVGDNFEAGAYFVGDLMYAAQILVNLLERLKPLMKADAGKAAKCAIVLGTVEGDIHDIGKNIFKALSEAAGFEVIDIGIDQPAAAFVDAVKTNSPKIVGLSGVLTLAIESMKGIVEALSEAGLRNGVKVMIGGNAVSEDVCSYVGADYWSKNAAASVKKALDYAN